MRRLELLLLLAALPLILAGCFGLNKIQVFQAYIVNDTQRAVVVRDCEGFCSSSPIAIELAPGQSTPINRTANDHKYFSITTTSGGHIGCVDLYFKTPEQGATVPVSEAAACPGGSGPPWLAIGLAAAIVLVTIGLMAGWGPLRARSPDRR